MLFTVGTVIALAAMGCSAKSIKTYPVRGKVQLQDGDVRVLTGSHVELMQESNPEIRASGKIEPGGGYTLQTQYQSKILSGAPEGKYKVRIVLADESDEGVPKRKGDPIHRRFFDFDKSGISLTVPGGDYTISLSKK